MPKVTKGKLYKMYTTFILYTLLCIAGYVHSQATKEETFLQDLKDKTGLEVESRSYRNWAGNVERSPVYQILPTTQDQVQAAVRVCREYGVRVRAGGSAHSYADHGPNVGQLLVKMYKLQTNDGISTFMTLPTYYRQYTTVSTVPGTMLKDLMSFMADEGISFSSGTSSHRPSMGGITATGSHGHNALKASLSDNLVNLQVIQGDGEFREFDVDYNQDVFDIYRSHLGLCGIITRMTFKVDSYDFCKMFKTEWTFADFKVRDNLKLLIAENVQWIATWDIFSSADEYLINNMRENGGMSRDWTPNADTVSLTIHQVMPQSTTQTMSDAVNGRTFNSTFSLSNGLTSIADLTYGYFPRFAEYEDVGDEYPTTTQTEFAFWDEGNLVNTFNIMVVLADTIMLYAFDDSSVKMPIDRIEMSFTRHSSSCLLCPSVIAEVDPNKAAWVSSNLVFVVNFRFRWLWRSDAESLMEKIYKAWQSSNLQGLPHMGKHIPDFAKADMKTLLKDKMDTWKTMRSSAGVDPYDIFTNDFLDTFVFPDVDRSAEENAAASMGGDGTQSAGAEHHVALVTMLITTLLSGLSHLTLG